MSLRGQTAQGIEPFSRHTPWFASPLHPVAPSRSCMRVGATQRPALPATLAALKQPTARLVTSRPAAHGHTSPLRCWLPTALSHQRVYLSTSLRLKCMYDRRTRNDHDRHASRSPQHDAHGEIKLAGGLQRSVCRRVRSGRLLRRVIPSLVCSDRDEAASHRCKQHLLANLPLRS